MRMWMISPRHLCRQHLLGEHSEIHKHHHNFVKGHSMDGRVGQIEPASMLTRHDELVREMVRRAMNHTSPYVMPDISKYPEYIQTATVDIRESYLDLFERCEDCKYLMERMPL